MAFVTAYGRDLNIKILNICQIPMRSFIQADALMRVPCERAAIVPGRIRNSNLKESQRS